MKVSRFVKDLADIFTKMQKEMSPEEFCSELNMMSMNMGVPGFRLSYKNMPNKRRKKKKQCLKK